jgi:hypothetical protein
MIKKIKLKRKRKIEEKKVELEHMRGEKLQ